MSTPYDHAFYTSINTGSRASARVLLPLLQELAPVASVVDFGCGQGAWLQVWGAIGVIDRVGVDGAYIDTSALLFPHPQFSPHDLTAPVDLGRRFDLAQCLEVAEHLPESAASDLVETLTRHADRVLFSAAVPGQGGTHHINEKPMSWWRTLFAARDFVPIDPLRRQVALRRDVRPWYRYNTLLYVRRDRVHDFPKYLAHAVPDGTPIADLSPLPYKLRKLFLARLPVAAIDTLAKAKVMVLVRRATKDPSG